MKNITRIAPLLIVLVLGIQMGSRIQAINTNDDKKILVKKSKTSSNFKGIRIYPNPSDLLLFADSQGNKNNATAESTLFHQSDQPDQGADMDNELETEEINPNEVSSCSGMRKSN